jgi:hypothetical protein
VSEKEFKIFLQSQNFHRQPNLYESSFLYTLAQVSAEDMGLWPAANVEVTLNLVNISLTFLKSF